LLAIGFTVDASYVKRDCVVDPIDEFYRSAFIAKLLDEPLNFVKVFAVLGGYGVTVFG
jgi:hypothetical protein